MALTDLPSERPLGALPRVWQVAALLGAISDALAARFAAVAVRGELSGYARAASGHAYFTLKDPGGGGALRCAMFRRAASLLDFQPEDGQDLELRGRLAVYEPRGELQFVVESMQRAGSGALYANFLRLKAQLEAEGLFDADRKRPVSAYPRRLGIVTSLAAAVLRDVVTALARRAPHVGLVVYPSLVQGSEAPAALAEAIARAGARAEVDTLLLCRGGGSPEDLWAFNDAMVVRAIAACPLPVICGVGHETDVSLADFAADLRAPTPTAAAELAALPRAVALEALQALATRAHRAAGRALESQAQRLDRAAWRIARPARSLVPHRQRLEHLQRAQRLQLLARLATERARLQRAAELRRRSMAQQLARERQGQALLAARLARAALEPPRQARQALALMQARLLALDPARVLARGYAWLSGADGAALVSSAQVRPGDSVVATLADGRLRAEVSAVERLAPGE